MTPEMTRLKKGLVESSPVVEMSKINSSSNLNSPNADSSTPKKLLDSASDSDNVKDKKEKKVKEKKVGFFQLFRFGNAFDRMLIAIGTLAAIANGRCFSF